MTTQELCELADGRLIIRGSMEKTATGTEVCVELVAGDRPQCCDNTPQLYWYQWRVTLRSTPSTGAERLDILSPYHSEETVWAALERWRTHDVHQWSSGWLNKTEVVVVRLIRLVNTTQFLGTCAKMAEADPRWLQVYSRILGDLARLSREKDRGYPPELWQQATRVLHRRLYTFLEDWNKVGQRLGLGRD